MSDHQQIIALDAMGGDFGPEVVVPAAAMALETLGESVHYIFYGDEQKIQPYLQKYADLNAVSEVRHTAQKVASDEKPSAALRRKDTSMRLAIDAVKNGEAQSVVSAGNTGALMAIAKLVLRCLPGISRPAIASVFPSMKQDVVMLDLGANLQCDSNILVQFAVLGAVYAKILRSDDIPKVGILNVGSEDIKGPDHVREAAAILKEVNFPGNFYGFVEGDDIPSGKVDVVVTDGFTGNIALKVAEGVANMTGRFMKEAFMSSLLAKLGGLLSRAALRNVKKRMDARVYNGGMFLGLNGICVKSHGGMDAFGFSHAILTAAALVEQGYNEKVAQEIEHLMEEDIVKNHHNDS